MSILRACLMLMRARRAACYVFLLMFMLPCLRHLLLFRYFFAIHYYRLLRHFFITFAFCHDAPFFSRCHVIHMLLILLSSLCCYYAWLRALFFRYYAFFFAYALMLMGHAATLFRYATIALRFSLICRLFISSHCCTLRCWCCCHAVTTLYALRRMLPPCALFFYFSLLCHNEG